MALLHPVEALRGQRASACLHAFFLLGRVALGRIRRGPNERSFSDTILSRNLRTAPIFIATSNPSFPFSTEWCFGVLNFEFFFFGGYFRREPPVVAEMYQGIAFYMQKRFFKRFVFFNRFLHVWFEMFCFRNVFYFETFFFTPRTDHRKHFFSHLT